MKAGAWAETLEVGRRGEAVLDAVFGAEFIIATATPAHQRQGIDRFFIHRKDGRVIYRVDYKADTVAGRTGNLALEHISVVRKGRQEAAGWLHATIADLIVSFVPDLKLAFVLDGAQLRETWPKIMTLFPARIARTDGPRPYESWVCCPSITWLRSKGLIVRTVNVAQAQLRLPLRVRRPSAGPCS